MFSASTTHTSKRRSFQRKRLGLFHGWLWSVATLHIFKPPNHCFVPEKIFQPTLFKPRGRHSALRREKIKPKGWRFCSSLGDQVPVSRASYHGHGCSARRAAQHSGAFAQMLQERPSVALTAYGVNVPRERRRGDPWRVRRQFLALSEMVLAQSTVIAQKRALDVGNGSDHPALGFADAGVAPNPVENGRGFLRQRPNQASRLNVDERVRGEPVESRNGKVGPLRRIQSLVLAQKHAFLVLALVVLEHLALHKRRRAVQFAVPLRPIQLAQPPQWRPHALRAAARRGSRKRPLHLGLVPAPRKCGLNAGDVPPTSGGHP